MIEKLKTTLLEIRKERDDELQRYKSCGVDQERYANRKAILTLELPFKTDYASVVSARASAYQIQESARNARLEIDSEWMSNRQKEQVVTLQKGELVIIEEECVVVKKRIQKSSKNAYTFIEEWIRSADQATAHGRRTVYYVLKNWIPNFYSMHPKYDKVIIASPSALSAEDLPYVLTMESMETIIKGLDVDSSTKEVYISHARSLRDFVEKAYPISPFLKSRRGRLSLSDVAKLFEFLETRALKSTTIRAYHDVLLCRALFYAPLPEKKFFSLGAPDEKSSCLHAGDKVFYVPRSFIRLWKEFSCTNSLLSRTFDDRQLHKKIQRFGKYAGLTIESLTPSILRSSAKAIYPTYLSLSDDIVTLLPRRD